MSIGTNMFDRGGAGARCAALDGAALGGVATTTGGAITGGVIGATNCGVCVELFASSAFTLAASLLMWLSSGALNASSQCGALMKYSSVLVGIVSSMRRGMMLIPLWTARSTSRSICAEAFALLLKIRTMIFEPSSASIMDSAHDAPGVTSRGAIQHLMR